ncbi:MAG TPA: hypothetical protein VFG39_04585, partial [Balneolaceae bacterium]|nr:hypothetical protein [Balneolaceae bacterium]
MDLILLLIIAAVCGAIGQSIAGYSMGGCLASIAIGFIGALIGEWLAELMDLTYIFPITINGESFPVIWAILGSAIFSLAIGLIR